MSKTYQPKRLAVKVKQKAERMIRKEHPWIFDESITKLSQEGQAGDLAIIYDQKKNKFLAIGLYDPHSPIRIKILQSKKPATINEEWFEEKIAQAKSKREPLFQTDTNSYRLIYGENDGLPGLVADVYDKVLVLKLYSAIWLPYLEILHPLLQKSCASDTIVLRLSRQLQQLLDSDEFSDGQVLIGDLKEEEIIFREHGLQFLANVIHGHKTGYFLDHRHNRKRVGELAANKTVLDVFAYAGGFSVHALAGGAKSVSSLDISGPALEIAKKNVTLNDLDASKHQIIKGDAFKVMEDMARKNVKFDLVIVDPPSFAKKDSEKMTALQKYRRLTQLALQICNPQGIILMASCSSRVTAEDFFSLNREEMSKSRK
ncbi:MAG: class I SAM-dependent rRNA methyltransferase, partial [Bacteroidota bacterium]